MQEMSGTVVKKISRVREELDIQAQTIEKIEQGLLSLREGLSFVVAPKAGCPMGPDNKTQPELEPSKLCQELRTSNSKLQGIVLWIKQISEELDI